MGPYNVEDSLMKWPGLRPTSRGEVPSPSGSKRREKAMQAVPVPKMAWLAVYIAYVSRSEGENMRNGDGQERTGVLHLEMSVHWGYSNVHSAGVG